MTREGNPRRLPLLPPSEQASLHGREGQLTLRVGEVVMKSSETRKRRSHPADALVQQLLQRTVGGQVLVDKRDKYGTELSEQKLDCAERISLCKAHCCRLHFHLTLQDLEEGLVQWNFFEPYTIARREDGRCVHQATEGLHCELHAHRPAVCREYDCRKDPRVWLDFDARIPNPEL